MNFLTLDLKGVLLAVIFGILILILGLDLGYLFLCAMIAFLVLSAIVTNTGLHYKKALNLGQNLRGVKNVLANGLPPVLFVILFFLFRISGNANLAYLAAIGAIASIAAITSDKFSSEIGVLDGKPTMLFTLRKVRKGTSGAVTWLGLVAGLIGSFIIAILAYFLVNGNSGLIIAKVIVVVGISGFIGCIVDSMAGYYEEKNIGNKYTSNFVCGIIGGLVAMLILMI